MFVKLGRAVQIVILCSLLLAAPAAKPANMRICKARELWFTQAGSKNFALRMHMR